MKGMKQLCFAILWMLAIPAVMADEWLAPTPKAYTSSRGAYRLTVFPREPPDGQTKCEAVLERLEGNEYRRLWRKPLANDVSPVSALVSDKDGGFVTFDNWHSMGWGENAIVIYDGAGQLKRKLALTALMSKEEFERLPRSVSSIWWSGQHEFDHDEVVVKLRVVTGSGSQPSDSKQYRTIRLSLKTAQVLQ